MNQAAVPQAGDSVSGIEYPSALAALEDRQIFAIIPIDGGFEIREMGRDEHFVRLLPEQLRELGEDIVALAATAPLPEQLVAADAPDTAAIADASAPVTIQTHTIPIPSGIWSARVTHEFQARIAKLERLESAQKDAPKPVIPAKKIQPWIKP